MEPGILDLSKSEDHNFLTTRQRRTFAHEVAHICFFRNSEEFPVPTDEVKGERELEDICDRVARRILVPQRMLIEEINSGPGETERIDVEFVHAMKIKFCASYEVLISRLNLSNLDNASLRCIVLVRNRGATHKVVEGYFGRRILSFLAEPKERYQPLRDWLGEIPKGFEDGFGPREERITRRGRVLALRRFPIGTGTDFLLQVDVVPGGSVSI
jgi:hypothetical protein